MTDIFDEVDDIMSDIDSETTEISASSDEESNFNETELQDIMSEIENLEKDFDLLPTETAVPKDTLQQEIDREMEMSTQAEAEPVVETPTEPVFEEEAVAETPKVLPFDRKVVAETSVAVAPSKNSEISFEATGQMNLNLAFKIGDETAKLTIDPLSGLLVTLDGVELCINQDVGCSVTMSNGVKFTIPLTSSEASTKKKSA